MEAFMATNGIAPPDYTSDVGLVRLLIPDTSVDETDEFIFSDDQIDAMIGLFSGNVKRAAAQAKDVIASDTVMLLKVVRTDDLQVDGAKAAAELRLQAKSLRDQADKDDEAGLNDSFQIVYPQNDLYPEGVPIWGRARVEIVSREWA
jgi:hypothetical protein